MKKTLYIRNLTRSSILIVFLMTLFSGVKALPVSGPYNTDFGSIVPESAVSGIHNSGDSYLEKYHVDHASPLPAPPVISCPGNSISSTDPGLCSASVSGLAAIISDPDGDITSLTWTMTGATVAASPLTGINNISTPYTFNRGITTITYIVTDATLTSASCSFTVTVNDTQLPVITCPANINETYGEGICNTSITVGTPVATDNCGIPVVVGVRSDGLAINVPYPSGVTTITWTATDASGNSASCLQTITVTQAVLLVNYNFIGATSYPISPNQVAGGITCQATSSEPFFVNDTEGTVTGALSFVDNSVAFPSIYMDPSNFTNTRYFQFQVSGDSLYKYRKFKIYVQARRGNRAAQTINFAYSTDPVTFTVNGSMSLLSTGVWYEKVVDWSNVALINNRSNLYIRLFASNGTGGIGDNRLFIDNFQVVGVDGPLARPNDAITPENTPVVIPVIGNDYYGCNGPAAVNPITLISLPSQGFAFLNPDGTFTYTPNANVNGTDSFIYQICDASGSCDTSIVRITITPVIYPPVINCPGNINSGSDIGLCGAQQNDLAATYFDLDNNVTTLTWTMTGANNDASPPTGINYLTTYFFDYGTSTITYEVTDSDNLTATCSFTVTVNDSENPAINCPYDTVLVIGDCASITGPISLIPPQTSDNCGILGITNDAPAQFPLGTTSVIWTVFDINGNSSDCEQLVIVIQAAPLSLATGTTPVNCFEGSDGTATVTVSGGTEPYTYSWNTVPVQNTATATNLIAGTYTVIVIDADSCSVSTSVTVTQPSDSLTVSVTGSVNVLCRGESTGSVTVAGNGGTLPYTYSIDGVTFQPGGTFSTLSAGTLHPYHTGYK